MHDDYKQLDLAQLVTAPPNPVTLERCPVCGSAAQLWQYSESETSPRKLLGMCSHGELIGPQDGLTNEGCLLYMPPEQFYRETIRDAIRYWNEFAKALTAMRSAGVEVLRTGATIDEANTALAVARTREEKLAACELLAAAAQAEVSRLRAAGVDVPQTPKENDRA